MNKRFKQLILLSMAAFLAPLSSVQGAVPAQPQLQTTQPKTDWNEFHSVVGKCTLRFPVTPEHISEKMNVPDEGYELKYDAYIATQDKKNVYMLLIAQYPAFVDQTLAQASLEGFLNGILSNNPGNQLLFADMLLVEGHQAMDFFIRTGGIYFKGRAMMVKNQLYLMAMECEVQNYDEARYNYFVTSFKFSKQ